MIRCYLLPSPLKQARVSIRDKPPADRYTKDPWSSNHVMLRPCLAAKEHYTEMHRGYTENHREFYGYSTHALCILCASLCYSVSSVKRDIRAS